MRVAIQATLGENSCFCIHRALSKPLFDMVRNMEQDLVSSVSKATLPILGQKVRFFYNILLNKTISIRLSVFNVSEICPNNKIWRCTFVVDTLGIKIPAVSGAFIAVTQSCVAELYL